MNVLAAGCSLIALFLLVLPAPARADAALTREVKQLLKENDFSPALLPAKPFLLSERDPMLIRFTWEAVREKLGKLYQRRLKLETAPLLTLSFVSRLDRGGRRQVRVCILDPGNQEVRDSLVAAFRLPKDSFSEENTQIVTRTFEVTRQKLAIKGLDLARVEKQFQEGLAKEKSSGKLKPFRTETPRKDERRISSRWQFYQKADRGGAFYWRYYVQMKMLYEEDNRNPYLLVESGAEIGRKTASEKKPKVIGHTGKEGGPDVTFSAFFYRVDEKKVGEKISFQWQSRGECTWFPPGQPG